MVCDECNGKCCTRFIYLLTHKDVERISSSLNLDSLAFAAPWNGSILENYPFFLLNNVKHYLVLDHVPGTSECVFAMKLNGHAKCGIHSVKPLSCRTYPFSLNKENELDSVKTLVCPKQWSPEGKEKEQFRKNIVQLREELNEFKEIVGEWNANCRANKSFADFLHFIQVHSKKQRVND